MTRFLITQIGFLAAALLFGHGFTSAAEPGAAPRKVVVISGKKSHGPEGNRIHDYPWSAKLVKAMLDNSNIRDQVRVEFHRDGWPADQRTIEDADTIMIISDGRDGELYSEAPHLESPERVAFVERLMKRGCGLVTFHFSTFAPDKYGDKILDWNGGYFDWEENGARKWYSAIKTLNADLDISSPGHPIARGVTPFQMNEEFYYNLRFQPNDPRLRPLLTVSALGGRAQDGNVVAWAVERADGGRGFGTSCGHFYDNWKKDEFRKLVLNAVAWSAKVEVPPGGVEARYFEHDEITRALESGRGAVFEAREGIRRPADPWAVEDAAERAKLPLYQTIPAAKPEDLTPANGFPKSEATWHRSHGNAHATRHSALDQINRSNVQQLQVAWTYRSKDGAGNIQCNPVIANGMMFTPTVGGHMVAINAATGAELWRFKPGGQPAHRGLIYWPGDQTHGPRLYFVSGNFLHALDPKTGRPIADFGPGGRAPLPGSATAGPAIFQRVMVVPGFDRDVWGLDLLSGQRLWTFHTLPLPGEFGHETWSRVEAGANCWGGMALDEQRGIAYVATGSPKPNFVGTGHHGDNLFSNCLLALDALTGKRLWHFQEIAHDIWDWDIPAPPNLVTVTRDGKRVDAVAQVTKLGNTLLLDRLSGQPLFPVRLRRAPTSKLPGERTAPYQPDIQLPEPFARQQFSRADVTTRNEEAREFITKRVANVNCGWFEPFEEGKPTALYNIHGGAEWTGAAFDPASGFLYVSANEIPWIVTVFRDDNEPPRDPKNPTLGEKIYEQSCASCHGPDRVGVGVAPPLRGLRHRLKDADVLALLKTGRNLMPPAPPMTDVEQKALLDFIFLRDRTEPVSDADPLHPAYTHNGYPKLLDHENYPGNKPPWGTLNCIDLNSGKLRWKVPLGEYPELTAQGIPKTGTENFGGAMVTAGGLVFCSGTRDNLIRAFDSRTGAELWSHKLPLHGTAPPATYSADGRQFVVIAATGGGKLGGPTGDHWMAFALPK